MSTDPVRFRVRVWVRVLVRVRILVRVRVGFRVRVRLLILGSRTDESLEPGKSRKRSDGEPFSLAFGMVWYGMVWG